MKIYLVRHGQSRWQVERNEDDWDSPLTEIGQEQAKLLGKWLATKPTLDFRNKPIEIARIFCSPLLRAQQTAEPTATNLGLPIETLPTLKESDFWLAPHLPQFDSPAGVNPSTYTPSTPYQTFAHQAESALQTLATHAQDGSVLAFAHGGLIGTILRQAVSSHTVSFWVYNASITLLRWQRGRWHLIFLNLSDHLPRSLRTY